MDKALKQRLVGASVLIALAVVVLPMLLGGRPEGGTQETQKIEIPPQPPELSFETRRYPIGQQTPKNQGASQGDEPDETVTQLPAPRKPAVTPVPAAETAGTESGVPAGDEPVVADSVTAHLWWPTARLLPFQQVAPGNQRQQGVMSFRLPVLAHWIMPTAFPVY